MLGAESAHLRFSASLDGFELTVARAVDSLAEMIRERTLRKRKKLVAGLPITGELLRGSLLERVVRHKSGCLVRPDPHRAPHLAERVTTTLEYL